MLALLPPCLEVYLGAAGIERSGRVGGAADGWSANKSLPVDYRTLAAAPAHRVPLALLGATAISRSEAKTGRAGVRVLQLARRHAGERGTTASLLSRLMLDLCHREVVN